MPGILGTKAPLTSDINLLLQAIIFVILIVGSEFVKEKPGAGRKKHKNLMTVAVALNIIPIILVMVPSFLSYFSGPLQALPIMGIVSTSVHAFFGAVSETLGIAFVLEKKPKNMRLWMRLTRWFWIITEILGVFLYLQVAGVI